MEKRKERKEEMRVGKGVFVPGGEAAGSKKAKDSSDRTDHRHDADSRLENEEKVWETPVRALENVTNPEDPLSGGKKHSDCVGFPRGTLG